MTNFDAAFSLVIGEEGGYTFDASDPGGETKYGLSKRANPSIDIKNLTLDQAKAIYRQKYWPTGADTWPWCEALLCFDTAVNGGNWSRWHSMLSGQAPEDFVTNFQAEHNIFLASLPTWPIYGRGWSRRLLRMAIEALRHA